jgi:DNA-binding NtrC family response regulator
VGARAHARASEDDGKDLTLAGVEKRHIQRVLNETMWQRGHAASLLGIHRTTLANKIREYGLDRTFATAGASASESCEVSVAAGCA